MRLKARLLRAVFGVTILMVLPGWGPVQIETAQPFGQSLAYDQVGALPLSGRNFDLIFLKPGPAVVGPSAIMPQGNFTLDGVDFPVDAAATDGNGIFGIVGPEGVLELNSLTGTKQSFSGIVGRPKTISYAGGGYWNVGVGSNLSGQYLLDTCYNGVCTPNLTGGLSLKPYDAIKKLTFVPGIGTYAVGTNSVLFATNNNAFVDVTPDKSAAPYYSVNCNSSNYCGFAASGGLYGAYAGQPLLRLTAGLPSGTSKFTDFNSNLSGWMAVAEMNFGASYVQTYFASGSDVTKLSFQLTPQVNNGYTKYSSFLTTDPSGNFVLGTNWGAVKYQSGAWLNFSIVPDWAAITALANDSGGLRAGGPRTYPSYNGPYNDSYWPSFSVLNTDVCDITPAYGIDYLSGRDGGYSVTPPNGTPISVTGFQTGDHPLRGAFNPGVGLIFTSKSGGVYKLNPDLMSVSPFNNGISNAPTVPVTGDLSCGSNVYAFRASGVYWTSGTSWTLFPTPPPSGAGSPITGVCIDPMTFHLGYDNGDLYQFQVGQTQPLKLGSIPVPGARVNRLIQLGFAYSFARTGRQDETATPTPGEFAATSKGLYGSVDGGATWFAVDRSLGTSPVLSLAADATHLYVGTESHGLVVYALPIQFQRLVPIVLDVDTGSVHYTSEVAVTNRNTTTATVALQYTASLGSGSGTVTDTIAPGLQLVIPDVMAHLRQKGLTIPAGGSQAGTLLLTFNGITDGDAVAVTVRTTTATAPPLPVGRTGLAYSATDPASGTDGSLFLYGLRSTDKDRANVAVFNTSATPVSVRVTAFSGAGDGSSQVIVASDPLPAWGWKQYNRILDGTGFTNGWVRIDRVSGARTYFSAYAVINDNVTNDGSFVLPAGATPFLPYANVPVVVETPAFSSEFVLANSGSAAATFQLSYRESLGGTQVGTASLTLPSGTQLIQPNAIAWLRSLGIPIGPAGSASYAGLVHVEVAGVTPDQIYAGARTASIAPGGGEFGVFTPAFTPGTEGEVEGWIYGLRADAENRSNVAVAHTGGTGDGTITLSIQAYNGDNGGAAAGSPTIITLEPGQWQQFNDPLRPLGVANGWVNVTRTAGIANWIAYGVINDGGAPGQGTGDGSYVPMSR